MKKDITPSDVADWMLARLKQVKYVYQDETAWKIKTEFGDDFVYTNENGNLSISRAALKEFRKKTEDAIVWERGSRSWRYRASWDSSGKRGVD